MQELGNITEIVVVAIASMAIALVARRQKILDLGVGQIIADGEKGIKIK